VGRCRRWWISVTGRGLFGALLLSAADTRAGETWHQLTPRQATTIINTLAPTQLRPVAPAFLPPGFSIGFAEADASTRFANGDYDPSFRIEYRGPKDQCFGLRETKAGPRGLQKVRTVKTAISAVTIYSDPAAIQEGRMNSLSAFPVDSVILRTPSYQVGDPTGSPPCKPISLSDFNKVVESLRWLKK
jgi:hypothetical protein